MFARRQVIAAAILICTAGLTAAASVPPQETQRVAVRPILAGTSWVGREGLLFKFSDKKLNCITNGLSFAYLQTEDNRIIIFCNGQKHECAIHNNRIHGEGGNWSWDLKKK
jgi:hypothetical protein